MPTNKFYLDEQKTQEIEMSWRGLWKDITVKHNGVIIGGFLNFSHLKQGQSFVLSDGSRLDIHFSNSYGDQGLRIAHNGRPLKGSSGDPEAKLKGIFAIACVIGGLNFIVGALGEFGDIDLLREMGANWFLMVIGAIIIGLGYLVMKNKSQAALVGIILIISLDIVLTLMMSVESRGGTPVTAIGLKVLFIVQFARGFSAITEYKNAQVADRNLMNQNFR